jgi:hypothetical protein
MSEEPAITFIATPGFLHALSADFPGKNNCTILLLHYLHCAALYDPEIHFAPYPVIPSHSNFTAVLWCISKPAGFASHAAGITVLDTLSMFSNKAGKVLAISLQHA